MMFPVLPSIAAFEQPMPFVDAPTKTMFIDKNSPDIAKTCLVPIAEYCRREKQWDKTPFIPIDDDNIYGFFWDGSDNPKHHSLLGGGQILADRNTAKLLWIWLHPALRGQHYVFDFCDYYLYRFNHPQV